MRGGRSVVRLVQIAGLGLLLSVQPGQADEVRRVIERAWGTPWDTDAVSSLPGCEGQGEIIAEIHGYLARVAQPECVGYRLWNQYPMTLILIYRDIPWHSLDSSRRVVDNLLASRGVWGLAPTTVDRLGSWAVELERLARLRRLYGDDPPVLPPISAIRAVPHAVPGVKGYQIRALPPATRGLQGYQINFSHEHHAALKSALRTWLGTPTRETRLKRAAHHASPLAEVQEWRGNGTVAKLQEIGSNSGSGYFVIVTEAYLALLNEEAHPRGARAPTPALASRPPPVFSPWILGVLERFDSFHDPPLDTP